MTHKVYIRKNYAVAISIITLCVFSLQGVAQTTDTLLNKASVAHGDTLAEARRKYYKFALSLLFSYNKVTAPLDSAHSGPTNTSLQSTGIVKTKNPFSFKYASTYAFITRSNTFSPAFSGNKFNTSSFAPVNSFCFNNPFKTNAPSPTTPLNTSSINTNLSNALKFSNPTTSGQDMLNQQIINTPTQFIKGINGIGSSKDQMMKMAALRSQMISQSISQNFSSLSHPTFGTALTLENAFLYQPVLGSLTGKKYQNIIGINGSLIAFGIPLHVNISNNQSAFSGVSPLNSSLFKLGFDPSMFSGLLKSELQQYSDLKNTVFHGFSFTGYLQQTISEKVSSIQGNLSQYKQSPFFSYLNSPSQFQQLISLPDKQLRQQLITSINEKYIGDLKKPFLNLDSLKQQRQMNYQKADSLADVITAVKSNLRSNDIDPYKLLVAENYLNGRTSSLFNSSEAVNAMYTKGSGNILQSVFGVVKDLRAGSFGNQIPGGTQNDVKLMNGAGISLKLGDYPISFGYGRLGDINATKDAGYQSSIYEYPKNITYFGAQLKRGSLGDVKVSVIGSFSGAANSAQYSTPTLPGSAVAFTVTKAIKTSDAGNFTFDVSKSGTLYSSAYQPGNEVILAKKAGINDNLSGNLFQSYSVGFTHSLDLQKINASDNVYFNYAGNGYQNPANNGYSGATLKFGGTLRKGLYNNKLQLNFRTDYRSMPLSYTNNDKWRNYQIQLDSRYQVSSKFNLSLKYIEASTTRSISGESSSVYDSKKFELSANNTFKIGKYFTTSRFSISDQSLTNTYESASGASLLNVNYVQSIVFKNSSLTGTVFYNKELTNYVLIGDLLTSDMTYQYSLLKNVQLGSGLTYLNNTGIAKQAGVRQSLQVTAGKHFDINASLDLRKNLITPQYADLYASCRGELSIKYYFKID